MSDTMLDRLEEGLARGGYPVVCENCGHEWTDDRFGLPETRLLYCTRCPVDEYRWTGSRYVARVLSRDKT